MREFAAFLVRNRLAAGLAASLGAALPLLGIVGGATAALLTLHQGLYAGLVTVGLGAAIASGLTWVIGGVPPVAAMLALSSTLPACALAWVLRRSTSLALTVQAATVTACAGVLLVLWGLDDAAAFWRGLVETWLAAAGGDSGISEAERDRLLGNLPFHLMTGSVAANVMLLTLASLFLGRSAQARLVNPGGFRREFHSLRLGRVMLAGTAAVLLAGMVSGLSPLLNLAAVVLAAWLLQGLAVIHGVTASLGVSAGWLVVSYALLGVAALMASPVVLLFPLLGMLDELIDLRGRLGRDRRGRESRGDDE